MLNKEIAKQPQVLCTFTYLSLFMRAKCQVENKWKWVCKHCDENKVHWECLRNNETQRRAEPIRETWWNLFTS